MEDSSKRAGKGEESGEDTSDWGYSDSSYGLSYSSTSGSSLSSGSYSSFYSQKGSSRSSYDGRGGVSYSSDTGDGKGSSMWGNSIISDRPSSPKDNKQVTDSESSSRGRTSSADPEEGTLTEKRSSFELQTSSSFRSTYSKSESETQENNESQKDTYETFSTTRGPREEHIKGLKVNVSSRFYKLKCKKLNTEKILEKLEGIIGGDEEEGTCVEYFETFDVFAVTTSEKKHNLLLLNCSADGRMKIEEVKRPSKVLKFIEITGNTFKCDDLCNALMERSEGCINDVSIVYHSKSEYKIGNIIFELKQPDGYDDIRMIDKLCRNSSRKWICFDSQGIRECRFIFSPNISCYKIFDITSKGVTKTSIINAFQKNGFLGHFRIPKDITNGSVIVSTDNNFITKFSKNRSGYVFLKTEEDRICIVPEYCDNNQLLLCFNRRKNGNILKYIREKISSKLSISVFFRINSLGEIVLHVNERHKEKVLNILQKRDSKNDSKELYLATWRNYIPVNIKNKDNAEKVDTWLKRDTCFWNYKFYKDNYDEIKDKNLQEGERKHRCRVLNSRMQANTIMLLKKGSYNINNLEIKLDNTISHRSYYFGFIFSKLGRDISKNVQHYKPNVEFVKGDCITVASNASMKGSKVGLLVMANTNSACGTYKSGGSGLEESLARRSTILYEVDSETYELKSKNETRDFRWGDNIDLVVFRDVSIFRSEENEGGKFYEKPRQINVISASIEIKPSVDNNTHDYESKKSASKMFIKIASVFILSILEGIETLVLTPIGCGSAKHPQYGVIQIIVFLINMYSTYFKKIIVCSLGDCITEFERHMKRFRNPNLKHQFFPCKSFLEGKLCEKIGKEKHDKKYFHPQACVEIDNCRRKGVTHELLYLHKKDLEEVEIIKKENKPACKYGYLCTDFSPEHCKNFTHPDICTDKKCKGPQICGKRHKNMTDCKDGLLCLNVDHSHYEHYRHYQNEISGNLLGYGSMRKVCPFGLQCKFFLKYIKKGDLITYGDIFNHMLEYVHIPRHPCKDGKKCEKAFAKTGRVDEQHIVEYSHPGIKDYRDKCTMWLTCSDFTLEHRLKYSHPVVINLEKNSNLNLPHKNVDFYSNRVNVLMQVRKYYTPDAKLLEDVTKLVRSMRPVHRLSYQKIESCLQIGAAMARSNMDISDDPVVIAEQSQSNSELLALCKKYQKMSHNIKEYFKAAINKKIKGSAYEIPNSITNAVGQVKPEIDRIVETVVSQGKALKASKTGIGYDKDVVLKTNNSVFTNVGPNTLSGYGLCCLIFDREILYNPASWFNLEAATYYISCMSLPNRPYISLKNSSPQTERVENYWHLVQNMGITKTDECLAHDLICVTKNRYAKDPTMNDVMNYLLTMNSHNVVEGHLPLRVPMTQVRAILMYKNEYDSLSPERKKGLDVLKDNCKIITNITSESEFIKHMIEECITNTTEREKTLQGLHFVMNADDEIILPHNIHTKKNVIRFKMYGGPLIMQLGNNEAIATIIFEDMLIKYYLGNHTPITIAQGNVGATKEEIYDYVPREIFKTFQVEVTSEKIVVSHIGIERTIGTPVFEFLFKKKVFPTKVTLRAIKACKISEFIMTSKKIEKTPLTYEKCGIFPKKVSKTKKDTINNNKPAKSINLTRNTNKNNSGNNINSNKSKSVVLKGKNVLPLCKHPYECGKIDNDSHRKKYKHYCKWGQNCKDIDDKEHNIYFKHLEVKDCPKGNKCRKLNDFNHRITHNHGSQFKLIPSPCKYGDLCKKKNDVEHLKLYYHPSSSSSSSLKMKK